MTEDQAAPSGRSRQRYDLKTAMDVAALFAKLDPDGRAILAADLVLAGKSLAAQHPLVRAITRIQTMTWIDDDKGRVTHKIRAWQDGPEIAEWDATPSVPTAMNQEPE